ncbi:hypothetical protein M8J77_010239 [Diaphorina citri]|nr:hypothetical protein M8J77_010239 [Diaphorina citri]
MDKDPLEWLKYNCSPEYLLEEKWHRSFRERQIILQQKGLEYINEFPCLRAPGGYKLLADDFAIIHPDAHNRFTQKYGDIKSKILSRLHDHHSDKARNLIDLATVGEDEADVATFQAITYLLRRMHTFSVQGAKKKTVNPSRDQVLNSFLPHVPTVGDIPACLCLATRTKHVESFKEFVVPFIVAVGPSWRQVQQYDLVISKTVSYTFDKFLPALVVLYKILGVFDLPYAKESLPVWMVIQRAFFEMTSSYDIVGTPVQELLNELGYSSQ